MSIIESDVNFLDRLVGDQLTEHPAYYCSMVWILIMMELWLAQHEHRSDRH